MNWRLRLSCAIWVVSTVGWAAGPTIVIDPGHGGEQQGAISALGVFEKDIALAVSKKVKQQLELQLGATVALTRASDRLVHLSDRVSWANSRKPDAFLSIHANSMPTDRLRASTEGIETYFLSASASDENARRVAARENAELGFGNRRSKKNTLAYILADLQKSEAHADSSRLAYALHRALVRESRAVDRGVQQAPFYVLMGLQAPAVLIEIGFISNPDEGRRLGDSAYQDKLAQAIAQGFKEFWVQIHSRDLRAP